MKTTFTTEKLGLRPAITPVDEAASRTSLASLAWVNPHHLATDCLCFVLKETPELEETPRVQSSAGFPMIDLNPISDVREVLKHDSSTRIYIPDNRTGDNVVAISSESLFTSSKDSEMPLGRLRSFSLQFTPEAKYTFNNFLHMLVPMKTIIRANSRSSHSQVHTDCFPIGNKFYIGESDNNMKIKPVPAIKQVSRSSRIADCILGILGKIKNNLNSSFSSSKIHDALFPIQSKSVQVVSRWAKHRLGASCFQSLLLSGNCRLNGFSGLLPGLDMKVRNEIRQSSLAVTISQTMKRISIAVTLFPTSTADSIKRLGELYHRFIQGISLLFCRFKRYTNRSVHIDIIPYITKILQYKEVNRNSSVA